MMRAASEAVMFGRTTTDPLQGVDAHFDFVPLLSAAGELFGNPTSEKASISVITTAAHRSTLWRWSRN